MIKVIVKPEPDSPSGPQYAVARVSIEYVVSAGIGILPYTEATKVVEALEAANIEVIDLRDREPAQPETV